MPFHAIALLVVIPLIAGLISIALVGKAKAQRFVGTLSFVAMLTLALGLIFKIYDNGDILVSQMGGWAAPYGIALIFDSLSGLLLAAGAMVGLGCYIHSFAILDPEVERRYFHPLIQFLMFGVNLSFLTGDLFNLFVAFEIMLMASYALLCIGGARKQITQAYKYVILNLVASAVFVMGAGLVYGMMGTLNMADLMQMVQNINADQEAVKAGTMALDQARSLPTGFTALSVMMLLVFGLKGAFFPLWFWLPDTYYTCPISIAALFGGMLTKVGVYAVLRTFPLIFAGTEASANVIGPIVAVAAAFTMFLGVLGAVSNHEVRRILSVHVISQVGYMVFGIAVGIGVGVKADVATAAFAGCLFYMIQHMVVKSALFLCCGVMEKHAGSDNLNKVGGLLKRDVWLGVLFFIAAMSLVGLPPLSGFFGKLTIIQAGWNDFWVLSMFGLITGGLTLLSMLKIWSYGYWSPSEGDHADLPKDTPLPKLPAAYTGITMLVVTALLLGFGAQPIYHIAFHAGRQLNDPTDYINAVNPTTWQAEKPDPKTDRQQAQITPGPTPFGAQGPAAAIIELSESIGPVVPLTGVRFDPDGWKIDSPFADSPEALP